MIDTASDHYVVTEVHPTDGFVITVRRKGEYYRIPLRDRTPAFESVDSADSIVGPVVFTPEMERAFTRLEENASGSSIRDFLSLEEAVLLGFYRQVGGVPAGESLTFSEAIHVMSDSRQGYLAATQHIASAEYSWDKANADAWRRIKEQLGQ